MNSLEILDTVQKRIIYVINNHSCITIRLTQFLALFKKCTRSDQSRLARTRTNLSYKLINPSGPFRSAFRKSKKIINYRWICEPICAIYYAAAQRHALHEPFPSAVNLVRNFKPRLVFANHRNKQPHVTRAWRHGIHRYITIIPWARVGYLQVNALSEWIIGIYLHEFTNNEREISIPHEATDFYYSNWIHCKQKSSNFESAEAMV